MTTITPDTVRRLAHRFAGTGAIAALAADWFRQRERILELERQMVEVAEPFAALVAEHAKRIVELEEKLATMENKA